MTQRVISKLTHGKDSELATITHQTGYFLGHMPDDASEIDYAYIVQPDGEKRRLKWDDESEGVGGSAGEWLDMSPYAFIDVAGVDGTGLPDGRHIIELMNVQPDSASSRFRWQGFDTNMDALSDAEHSRDYREGERVFVEFGSSYNEATTEDSLGFGATLVVDKVGDFFVMTHEGMYHSWSQNGLIGKRETYGGYSVNVAKEVGKVRFAFDNGEFGDNSRIRVTYNS